MKTLIKIVAFLLIGPMAFGQITYTYDAVGNRVAHEQVQTAPSVEITLEGVCSSGTLDASASEGNSPYTYLWSNGAISQSITALENGTTYSVVVTDNSGCAVEEEFLYSQPMPDFSTFNIDPCNHPTVISWDPVPGAVAYQFFGQRAGTGNPQLSRTTSQPGFNVPGTVPNNFQVEIQLRSQCSDGSWSDWTPLTHYTITCNPNAPTPANVKTELFEEVDISVLFASLQVYPSPAENELFVALSAQITMDRVEVFDVNGRQVMNHNANGSETITLDISKLQPGHYIIKASNAEGVFSESFVKM